MDFQLEELNEKLLDEAMPLLEMHWKEIAHYPDILLDVDRDFYLACAKAALIRLYTVRDQGALVGYSVFLIRQNPHYKASKQANNDILYLNPKVRGGLHGYRFIKWCDEQLAAEGVQVVYHHVKEKHNFGPMLERMNYELIDLIYGRRLS